MLEKIYEVLVCIAVFVAFMSIPVAITYTELETCKMKTSANIQITDRLCLSVERVFGK